MAFFQSVFNSKALVEPAHVNMIIPDQCEKDIPVVYLLHGLFGDQNSWIRYTSIERYANDRGLAIVMPYAADSFYSDMHYGKKFYTYITEELPAYLGKLLPLTQKREKSFVAGLSMGGYGAMKIAMANPERYAACAALSAPLYLGPGLVGKHNERFVRIWGENYPETLPGSIHDPLAKAMKLEKSGKPLPRVFQSCGTEDTLYPSNIPAKAFFQQSSYDYAYHEGPGAHTWDVWDHYIPMALDFFIAGNEELKAGQSDSI